MAIARTKSGFLLVFKSDTETVVYLFNINFNEKLNAVNAKHKVTDKGKCVAIFNSNTIKPPVINV